MGKYEPLARYLQSQSADSWRAKFHELEKILGFPLPRSAHEYPAWWANQDGHHSQTKAWRDAGWETREVDLRHKTVCFERSRRLPNRQPSVGSSKKVLTESAKQITGIADEDALVETALRALIQREVARGLIALGGTDPNAAGPPRRRFL